MTAPNIAGPSKPVVNGAKGVGSQRDRRFTDTFFDIHKSARFPRGRPWTGEREYAATPEMGHQPGFISADLQCGEYFEGDRAATLASAWSAPWLPLAKYFKFDYQRKLISFKYDKMEADERESLDRYYNAAAKLSGSNGWGEIVYGKVPSFQITALIGEPSKYLKIAQAARAGDPWLLGHIPEPNEELAQVLNLSRRGFYMPVEAKPPVTAEQVLATAPADIAKMIAEAVATALEAERERNRSRTSKARATKGAKRSPAESNAT